MILVTGGSGLLGAHLLVKLSEHESEIFALKTKHTNLVSVKKIFKWYNKEANFTKIKWIEGDVTDIFSLLDALNNIEYVYHCAALVSFNPRDRKMMKKINSEGTANLVNACLEKNIKKLCYVSSTAAIGRGSHQELITEDTPWKISKQNSYYSITKYNAEREVWRGIEEGLNAVIINPCVIIGPGNWNKSSNAMFKTAYKGMPFYTEGSNAFVDARDVANIMVALMNSNISSERFLAVSENVKFKDLFSLIAQEYGNKPPYIKVKSWLSNIAWRVEKLKCLFTGKEPRITRETALAASRNYNYSNKKITEALGYQFISVKEAIKNACDYYKNNESL
jgi:nucleoside-diphosphate-sugar epimerase